MEATKTKRMDLWRKKRESEVWKIADSEVRKVRKWQIPVKKGQKANERSCTEGEVEAAEGNTEARRKEDNGCSEVRNREEVPELM